MQPPTPPVSQDRHLEFLVRYRAFIIIFFALVVGFLIYATLQYRITGTNPSTSKITKLTPFIQVNFNRTLQAAGIQITSSADIVQSYSVSGSALKILFKSPLTVGATYTITLVNIPETKGKSLTNKQLHFKVIDATFASLPKDQQQAILAAQSNHPYAIDYVTFNGLDELLNHGVSATQVSGIQQSLFAYSVSSNKLVKQFDILTPTILDKLHPVNINTNELSFNIVFDSKTTYKVVIQHSGFNANHLYLYDSQTGALVYDGGARS